jgi:tRNA dimethylallyltransferase
MMSAACFQEPIDPAVRVWLVGGATASGKSVLALDLARTLGGEIVNADALQVYGDLRLLTARPSPDEEAAWPHHLFGVADGAERWSVGRWLGAARGALADIAGRGRVAVVVGGTGLYLRALAHGLAEIPPIPAPARAEAGSLLDLLGETAFRKRLGEADPSAAARIAPGDRLRLARAMEVWLATGRPLSQWQADPAGGLAPGSWQGLVVDPPRAELYRRCDRRLEAMVEDGALEEVARLVARALPADRPVLKALGVAPLAAHLAGQTSLEEALAQAKTDTRRYAKRQLTWFRNQAPDWRRVGQEA